MKQVDGIWFPDNEKHLCEMVLASQPKVNGKGTYQYQKLTAALQYVKRKGLALDIGMHIGLWSMHLAKQFETVVGFEPVAEHIECLRLNMSGATNWEVHNCALGNDVGTVGLKLFDGSTGSTQILEGAGGITMRRLDDFTFSDTIDFIKIDVENYEYFVLEGGEKTIRENQPVIILEQKGNGKNGKLTYDKGQYASLELLKSWGAKQKFEMNGDYCLSWR